MPKIVRRDLRGFPFPRVRTRLSGESATFFVPSLPRSARDSLHARWLRGIQAAACPSPGSSAIAGSVHTCSPLSRPLRLSHRPLVSLRFRPAQVRIFLARPSACRLRFFLAPTFGAESALHPVAPPHASAASCLSSMRSTRSPIWSPSLGAAKSPPRRATFSVFAAVLRPPPALACFGISQIGCRAPSHQVERGRERDAFEGQSGSPLFAAMAPPLTSPLLPVCSGL